MSDSGRNRQWGLACLALVACTGSHEPTNLAVDASCGQSSECQTNCCAAAAVGSDMFCALPGYCSATCGRPGQACVVTDDCCLGFSCSPMNGMTCTLVCETSATCGSSGCCAPLNDGTDGSVCSPASYCE